MIMQLSSVCRIGAKFRKELLASKDFRQSVMELKNSICKVMKTVFKLCNYDSVFRYMSVRKLCMSITAHTSHVAKVLWSGGMQSLLIFVNITFMAGTSKLQ